MIEIGGKEYDLVFNFKTIKVIESQTGAGVVQEILSTRGALSLNSLSIYGGNALYADGARISPKMGMDLIDQWVSEKGYSAVANAVIEKLTEDCPFLLAE